MYVFRPLVILVNRCLIALIFGLPAASLSRVKAPNFVIIYADDLGYSQLSIPMMKDTAIKMIILNLRIFSPLE